MREPAKLEVPDNLEDCQRLILNMHEQLQSVQGVLQELLRNRYGKKSESLSEGQLRLFEPEPAAESTDELDELSVFVRPKKAHGRRKPAKELPRKTVVYDVPDDERPCPGCNVVREPMGSETTEQYTYSPSSIQVIEYIQIKRACKKCAEQVIIAPKPAEIIARVLAAPSMLAYVATSKFADHLPLNRLEGILRRDGAEIARSTMCDWMAVTADRLEPLYVKMKEKILREDVVWTDDTPVKMQDRKDPRNMRTARVWVYATSSHTLFDFTESRKRDGPVSFLGDFDGYLQADAFAGYDCIYAGGQVREVACMAHARRKFFDALKSNSNAAGKALKLIQDLYVIERSISESTVSEKELVRQRDSVPILEALKTWLDAERLVSLPKSVLGKAIKYALNKWKALNTYTSYGALSIDNNRAERALRGMAVGRKNWLFIGSARGGKTAAIITTFVATCKQRNIHPRVYLEDVLTRLAAGERNLEFYCPTFGHNVVNRTDTLHRSSCFRFHHTSASSSPYLMP